jgi:hypothetical protein
MKTVGYLKQRCPCGAQPLLTTKPTANSLMNAGVDLSRKRSATRKLARPAASVDYLRRRIKARHFQAKTLETRLNRSILSVAINYAACTLENRAGALESVGARTERSLSSGPAFRVDSAMLVFRQMSQISALHHTTSKKGPKGSKYRWFCRW